jgi:hypothetical protein
LKYWVIEVCLKEREVLDEGMGQETGVELLHAVSEGKELNMCTKFRPDKSGLEGEATVLLGGGGMTFV